MGYLVKVDIQTGRVLENNLREFWGRQPCGAEQEEAGRRTTCRRLPEPAAAPQARTGTPQDEALRVRVRQFTARRRRKHKNAWSEAELYRLAVLMGLQKQNYRQAAARLARTPRACQFMFKKLKDAGVI
ncbi:hypothetical protein IT084_01805 [Desulfallas sp. Bu1-1]|uniref:hypothetical protein n=1 Tax=Desulfallas sp. Bu1-1 TaxID=2787620 RepID=UPI00189E6F1C|nr:hypothetical protein [Desulfallas sp. Bu1-1]MBF7081716.1 hypothetical protein [Desulfallas sp. Bu1-1]